MKGRKVSFWLAVAGVSVVANYAVEALAIKFPNSGAASFAGILHKGASS
ncbi:MAG: hypothetical protein JWM85_1123 [Acidimicrobiaceae bacterium]|nr:hypothetical protein [Acidimicrobiaceae bacterium]